MYADARQCCGDGSIFGDRYRLCISGHEPAGCWFVEKIYENSLVYEFCKADLTVLQQWAVAVYYDAAII